MLRKIHYIDPSSANCYHMNNDIQYNLAKKFIDDNAFLINGRVLDIGSGDGRVTTYIASKISQPIIGVDISSDRVKFANDTYGTHKVKFVIGNASQLNEQSEVSSNQYGTIVSFCTLHHLPKSMQSAVFLQTKKLLAEDGVALFLMPGRSPELRRVLNYRMLYAQLRF